MLEIPLNARSCTCGAWASPTVIVLGGAPRGWCRGSSGPGRLHAISLASKHAGEEAAEGPVRPECAAAAEELRAHLQAAHERAESVARRLLPGHHSRAAGRDHGPVVVLVRAGLVLHVHDVEVGERL